MKNTKRFINPFTSLFIGNNYVANLNASKSLMKQSSALWFKKINVFKRTYAF